MDSFQMNILHQLYRRESRATHSHYYPYDCIRWLKGKSIKDANGWFSNDSFPGPTFEFWSAFDNPNNENTVSSKAVLPALQELQEAGFIRIVSRDSDGASIALAAKGIRPAKECGSRFGRLCVLYDSNKGRLPVQIATHLAAAFIGAFATWLFGN
jgi:hypothetical protein|tara:strand:- start:1659 stop:2123 length:465 start_codon:yes stop_codon:yes gene_type:complete